MNTYKKFYTNVFVAQCEQEYQKGEIITLTTKYGKENECIVHNLVGNKNGLFFYSITRVDGFNSQERAINKVQKLNGYVDSANQRANQWIEKAQEGKDFLSLGEPIKIGHHSEKRHRSLIERNWNRMSNAMNEFKNAETYQSRISYWENLAKKIDLSMPESLEFFEIQLEEAKIYHKGLKDGSIERQHSYSLTYANKKVKELTEKYEIAVKLWA